MQPNTPFTFPCQRTALIAQQNGWASGRRGPSTSRAEAGICCHALEGVLAAEAVIQPSCANGSFLMTRRAPFKVRNRKKSWDLRKKIR
jgi:hypothetical protein